jgi:MFS family permease
MSSFFGLLATLILLYLPDVSIGWMYVVLFLLGVGAGGQTVSFAVVKDYNPAHLVGTASGFNNLSVLVGGAIFQPLVGVILHRSLTDVNLVNGVITYSVSMYQKALLVMPCCFLASLILALWFIKESHPAKKLL